MAKKQDNKDEKPKMKAAQCFVCLKMVMVPVDTPKGVIITCDPCWEKHKNSK
jgi:hypothetical protein